MLTHRNMILRKGLAAGRRSYMGGAQRKRIPKRLARLKHVDARGDNENPSLAVVRFVALAPLGAIATGVAAT